MDTRDAILAAAVDVFATAGTRGATTRRIAEAAGVNEVTLFRQFGSKQALLNEALAWVARHVAVPPLPAVPADPPAELGAWCREHLRQLYGARSLLRTTLGELEENPAARGLGCEVPQRAAAELSAYIGRLGAAGFCRPDVDATAASALLMGALFADAVSRDVMPERYPWTLDEAADMYVTLVLRAIGETRGAAHE